MWLLFCFTGQSYWSTHETKNVMILTKFQSCTIKHTLSPHMSQPSMCLSCSKDYPQPCSVFHGWTWIHLQKTNMDTENRHIWKEVHFPNHHCGYLVYANFRGCNFQWFQCLDQCPHWKKKIIGWAVPPWPRIFTFLGLRGSGTRYTLEGCHWEGGQPRIIRRDVLLLQMDQWINRLDTPSVNGL